VDLGYARVSTAKQDLDRQVDALQQAGIAPERIYLDKKSGATIDRPGLTAALAFARAGDVLVVHTLDRLGRTVRDTLNLIHDLTERGVGVRNLADPIKIDSANPADPMAQLALVLLALFGQMERTYTLERAAHARAVATAKGRRIGRPTVVDPDKLAYAAHLRDAGHSICEIVAKTGIARTSLYRHLPPRPPVQLTEAPNTEERATLDRHQPAGPAESTPVEDRACEPAASAVKSRPASPQASSTTTTGQAPIRPGGRSGRRQVWFVVEADGRNDQAPVVVLSRHTTQRAAKAALVEACSRRPAREPGEVLEVRSADQIQTRLEWDAETRTGVVRRGPPDG